MTTSQKQKDKPKYSKLSNIAYLAKKVWQWDKIYFLWYLPLRPLRVLLSVIAIYIPKIIIDSVEQKLPFSAIALRIVLVFTASFLISTLLSFCNAKAWSRQSTFSNLFDLELVTKNLTTDYANMDNPELKNQCQRAQGMTGGWSAVDSVMWGIAALIANIFGLGTYGAIIMSLSPVIVILLILSSVITYLMGKSNIKFIDKTSMERNEISRKDNHMRWMSMSFDLAKEIRIYGMLDWINEMTRKFQKMSFDWTKKLNFRNFIIDVINALLSVIRDGAAYIILIAMLLGNKLTLGDFAFYFGAVTGFAVWLNDIANNFNNVVSSSITIGYYREYIETPDIFNHEKGCELPKEGELPLEFELKNVSYKYPSADNYTLKNINLKIKKGEKLAVVGENGAGKTTLVKLLCGYYYPTDGTISVNGKLIEEYNIEEYYTMLAAVFQDVHLLPVTIEEFVSCCDSENEKIDSAKLDTVIRQAELGEKITSLPNGPKTKLIKNAFDDATDMSGGEKQRLMLARALYKDAPCIILDEPTAALDPIAESNLYQKYNELTQSKTSLYISHRLASTRFCDRIIYMEDGEITETGTHSELMKKQGKYAHMFELQSYYYQNDINIEEGDAGNGQ